MFVKFAAKLSIEIQIWKKDLCIHKMEKPHVCQICNKAFTRTSHLKMDLRVNTKEKPYVCEVCSKVFSLSGGLKNRLLIHTKEKTHV
ncbi:UNVERIFIED_CONTAM: zinc finger protein [Trichonephila clavipes]